VPPETAPVSVQVTQPAASESPAWAIRLEAKVDVALAQHGARLDNHSADLADHEQRLREVEQRKTVSPWQLWLAVSGGVATFATLVAVLTNLPL
jgi:type II secretory pathway component PulL